jgi:lipid II:glycine glycyltransferase (peptidoglycan interpeptide bridge formation enzyme)
MTSCLNKDNYEYSIFCKTNSGYLSSYYSNSLKEFGKPVFLPKCGGWVLERDIPDFMGKDAMGCYPIFKCQKWSSLHDDLKDIGHKWISFTMVTDPFGNYSPEYLGACFPDLMIPFKQHHITDLHMSPQEFIVNHHKRNIRKATQKVKVEVCRNPLSFLNDWMKLYDTLIKRHHIHGIATFSKQSFIAQMEVPGLVVFRAIAEKETVGMILWYYTEDKAYYHLGAYNTNGYKSKASFALFSFAIKYFTDMGIRWLSLGAGAGTQQKEDDGLSRFKKGWSTGTRTAYFCGRILERDKYSHIVSSEGSHFTHYFPAYRAGEFDS